MNITPTNKSKSNPANKESALPIKSILNLRLLVEYWQKEILTDKVLSKMYASTITAQLEAAPELLKPIKDPKIFEKHKDLIESLMTVIFPPALQESEVAAAFIPFTHHTVYATPAYRRLFDYIQKCNKDQKKTEDK